MDIDVSGWAKRNMWPSADGGIAVRPGLKYEGDPGSFDYGSGYAAGWYWDVRNPFTGDLLHYAACWDNFTLTVTVFDENWAALGPGSGYTITRTGPRPATASLAVVLDQIMLCADGFRPLWGFVGGPLINATKVTSANELNTPAIELPTCGLVVEWAGRAVYAKDNYILVSDPVTSVGGSPRTVTGAGQVGRPGRIHGLHTNSRGDLFVCGTDGVWSLSADAASVPGHVVLGNFQQVSDYRAPGFGKTCLARDRVWGLTQKGVRLIDEIDGREWLLDEPPVATVEDVRIASANYQADAFLVPSARGPCVIMSESGAGGVCRIDADTGFHSWWGTGARMTICAAVLSNGFGDEVFVTSNRALRLGGNHDNTDDVTMTETAMSGGYIGVAPVPPDGSPVVRRVDIAHDGPGEAQVAIRGTQKTGTPPQDGVIIGTDVWDDLDAVFQSAPMSSKRLHFSQRTDDLSMEVMAQYPLTRLSPDVSVDLRGPGKRRPS